VPRAVHGDVDTDVRAHEARSLAVNRGFAPAAGGGSVGHSFSV
jgi:hypothetical protein